MMRNPADLFLSSLKRRLKAHSDEQLAAKLGVGKSTIASWRKRHMVPKTMQAKIEADHGLIFDEFEEMAANEMDEAHKLLETAFYLAILRLGGDLTEAERIEYAHWLGQDPHPMWKLIHGGRQLSDESWDYEEARMREALTRVAAGEQATVRDIRDLKKSIDAERQEGAKTVPQ